MESKRSKWGLIIASALIVIYTLAPVVWIISLSFKVGDDVNNGQFLPSQLWPLRGELPDRVQTPCSRQRCGTRSASPSSRRSSRVVLATLAAYAIARLDFPGKKFVLDGGAGDRHLPGDLGGHPAVQPVAPIGLYDTWPGLIIPYLSLTLPISIWTLSAFFREIPWEMEQAAQVDGATTWQAFRKVLVPLAAPGVFTTAIISFFIALERLRLRHLADVDRRRPSGAGGVRVLHRRVAVPAADGRHLGGRRRRHRPGRDPC